MTFLEYLLNITRTNNEKLSSVDQCFLLAFVEKFNSSADLGLAHTGPQGRASVSGSAADNICYRVHEGQAKQGVLSHKSFNLTTIVTDKQKATYPILFFS